MWRIRTHQRGGVTLLFVSVIALVMAVMTLTTSNVGLFEQRSVANELRVKEAREAAEAGLEFGSAWAGQNPIPWPPSPNELELICLPGGTNCSTLQPISAISGAATTSGESYSIEIKYTRGSVGSKYIRVESRATSSDISALSSAWLTQASPLTDKGKSAPPFVINGSLSDVTGGPDIDTGDPPGIAFVTSGDAASIDTGHFNKKTPPELGSIVQEAFSSAWDYVFSIKKEAAINLADANGYRYSTSILPSEPADGADRFYIWDSDDNINDDYGASDNPVVLIITDGNCPKINGGPVIYGFVYFPVSCSDQGWGGATIYGTIIAEGDITKVTANSVSVGSDGAGGIDMAGFFIDGFARIPGTWRDW